MVLPHDILLKFLLATWYKNLNGRSPYSACDKMSHYSRNTTCGMQQAQILCGGRHRWLSLSRGIARASGDGASEKTADVFLLSSYLAPPHNISICVCVLPLSLSLSLFSHTSPPRPDLPCSLAPLSSCFSGFLNCDISAAAPPPSSSSYCSCSSSSSPPRAMCGKSN